jgi:hypothetical protein
MRAILMLLSALALSACASGYELAMPSGDWHQLNAGKWTAHENDLTTPPPPAFAGHV